MCISCFEMENISSTIENSKISREKVCFLSSLSQFIIATLTLTNSIWIHNVIRVYKHLGVTYRVRERGQVQAVPATRTRDSDPRGPSRLNIADSW